MEDQPLHSDEVKLTPEEIQQAAQWLREALWQFVPPKEVNTPLALVDMLEQAALHKKS